MSGNSFVYDLFEQLPNDPITAKCCVHFRPDTNWNGEGYGFDWMRLGDTKSFGDNKPYEEIVAKQYVRGSNFNKIEMGINEHRGEFKVVPDMYQSLEKCYNPMYVPWDNSVPGTKKNVYYCSWLSLYPETYNSGPMPNNSNTTAKLRLYLDVGEVPLRLEFDNNPNFEITPKEITSDLKKGGYFWSGGKTITITCKKAFDSTQKIDVFAISKNRFTGKDERKLAGRLLVWSNKYRQKRQKILLVKVETPPISGTIGLIGKIDGQIGLFEKYLHQALISPDIKIEELNLSQYQRLSQKNRQILAYYDTQRMAPSDFRHIRHHLMDKLKEKLRSENKPANTYDGYAIFFYMGEKGGKIDLQGNFVLLNGSTSMDEKIVILFKSMKDESPSHELFHCLKLMHSFTNKEANINALTTYTYHQTENLMDYSHHPPGKPRYQLWKWQWEIANRNVPTK